MRRLTIAFLFSLACVSAANAQTHYCDTTPPTTGAGVIGVQETVSVCADGKDTFGAPVTITGWTLYDNALPGTPITMAKGTTSAVSGKSIYTGNYIPTTVGNHTLQVTSTGNGKESVKSTSFLLSVSNPPGAPTQPTNLSTN